MVVPNLCYWCRWKSIFDEISAYAPERMHSSGGGCLARSGSHLVFTKQIPTINGP